MYFYLEKTHQNWLWEFCPKPILMDFFQIKVRKSYVIFCKLAKIMKQVDNVRQGVSLFDVKPKHFNHSSLLAYTSQMKDFLYEAL